jgi:hypothetical protein
MAGIGVRCTPYYGDHSKMVIYAFGTPCLEFRLQAGLRVFRRSRLLFRDLGISKAGWTV